MYLLCLQHYSKIPGELPVQIVGVMECSEFVFFMILVCYYTVFALS
jgi:hypothetical protein